jgi:O-antigen/teichoic acid export membrane protein
MRSDVMKKNNFINGALIATTGIMITKLLGILYVIPFYAIIGEQGGALYGYAYNIYTIFLSLASVGIPLAMSKLISEYNTLGYYYSKERAFQLGKKVLSILGISIFLILILFAPNIAYLIIGNIKGGNTIQDVSFVIRIISLAILVVPILSISRGYLQGHKFITPSAISQIIEQIVRIIFVLVGSYFVLKVFHLGLTNAIGIAVFGATIGALVSYLYLFNKINKNTNALNRKAEITREEKRLTDNAIIKQLLMYAIPFIIIDISKNLYNSVDMLTLVKTLVNGLNYDIKVAESVMSVISTWGQKLNMIVIAISTGLITSLIPNLTSSFVANDIEDVRKKINKAIQILLYITIPMTMGLSFLSTTVWTTFYGHSIWGPKVFSYYIFIALFSALFTNIIITLQSLNKNKMVFTCLIAGLMTKIIFNIPLIYSFDKLGFYAFNGAITASILGYLIGTIIGLISLYKEFNISYEKTLTYFINILFDSILMILVLSLLKIFIPINISSRILSLFIIIAYSFIGLIIYLFLTYRNKTLENIFGSNIKNKIVRKLLKKQKNAV